MSSKLAYSDSSAILPLLTKGDYEIIEQQFLELDIKFKKGLLDERGLLNAYKVFYQNEDVYTFELNDWVKKHPNSYYAYLSRGIYFRKLGESRRGTGYISEVSGKSIDYMQHMHKKAKLDLNKALSLNKESYLSELHLLNIAQFEGDRASGRKHLERGVSIYPKSLIFRARYLIMQTPRWGGDFQLMKSFVDQEKKKGLSSSMINKLSAILYEEIGFSEEENENVTEAYKAYEKALGFSLPYSTSFRNRYVGAAMQLCQKTKYKNKSFCQW